MKRRNGASVSAYMAINRYYCEIWPISGCKGKRVAIDLDGAQIKVPLGDGVHSGEESIVDDDRRE